MTGVGIHPRATARPGWRAVWRLLWRALWRLPSRALWRELWRLLWPWPRRSPERRGVAPLDGRLNRPERGVRPRHVPPERGVRPRPVRPVRVALLATLALALAGCQAIPSSGPVREGLTSLSQADQPVQFNPGGPTPGSSQEDIVRGFISAASSSADDYAIAREFLTFELANSWEPEAGVLVDEGTQQYRDAGDTAGVLSVSAIAAVDGRGALQPLGPGEATELRFEFAEVDGEWRISSAPSGIVLDKSTFTAVWAPMPLYFLNASNRLVPDTRWFLNRPTITTQIVGELLAGPTEGMSEVLYSAFPGGTTLVSGAVPVVDGTARIDLSVELLQAGTATLDLVKRQLGASLQAVPEVARYEILVDGSRIDQGPVTASDSTSPSAENAYVAVLKNGVFGAVRIDSLTPLPDIGPRIAALQPSAVTLAPDRRSAAVVGVGGLSLVTGDGQTALDARGSQLAPSLDRFGYVWSASAESPGTVRVMKPGEPIVDLSLPWLDSREPVSVRVSQGGSRVAVLVPDATTAGWSKVLIAGIARDADGTPLGITDTATIAAWASGVPTDLDWIDEQRLVVLTRSGASGLISQVSLGQFAVESGSVAGAVAVSGGGSRTLLRVLDDDGRLYAPQGSGWQRQQDDVTLVARVG